MLKQTGSIAEYYARFEQLVHSILLHNGSHDDVYLVTHFLGGLREDIRAPIALHHPKDVDTASALALLQEEELESHSRIVGSHSVSKDQGKSTGRVFSSSDF